MEGVSYVTVFSLLQSLQHICRWSPVGPCLRRSNIKRNQHSVSKKEFVEVLKYLHLSAFKSRYLNAC